MNARVVTVQLRPDKVDQAVRQYRDIVVPAAKKQKGYKGKLLFVNRDTRKALSITLWETKADMIASESSGYLQTQFSSFQSFFTESPTTEHYDVSVSTDTAPTPSRS